MDRVGPPALQPPAMPPTLSLGGNYGIFYFFCFLLTYKSTALKTFFPSSPPFGNQWIRDLRLQKFMYPCIWDLRLQRFMYPCIWDIRLQRFMCVPVLCVCVRVPVLCVCVCVCLYSVCVCERASTVCVCAYTVCVCVCESHYSPHEMAGSPQGTLAISSKTLL